MAKVVSFDDVLADRIQKTGRSGKPYWRTSFVTPQGDDDPQAYLIENSPDMTIASHFHDVDEFQIVLKGIGLFGRTEVAPFSVHFARAFTNYGPIESRGEGLAWMTLRPRRDLGAKMIDLHREKLEGEKGRQPWQTTVRAEFPVPTEGAETARCAAILEGDHGLAAMALTLSPGQEASAPDPGTSPCQYILVTEGSLIHGGQEQRAITVIHVAPTDSAFRLIAGPQGLQCLILNFPYSEAVAASAEKAMAGSTASAADGAKAWHCELCGFVYQESEGLPSENIPPGTPWADVPEDFLCPDCSATKSDFTRLS